MEENGNGAQLFCAQLVLCTCDGGASLGSPVWLQLSSSSTGECHILRTTSSRTSAGPVIAEQTPPETGGASVESQNPIPVGAKSPRLEFAEHRRSAEHLMRRTATPVAHVFATEGSLAVTRRLRCVFDALTPSCALDSGV